MNINEKIIQYLEYKDISQRKFTISLKMGEGVLRGGKNIGSGYLKRIKIFYPDLSMNWLLFDEGNMLLSEENAVNDDAEIYIKEANNVEILKNELENAKKLLEAKNETISVLKHQLGIDNSKNGNSKAS